MSVGLELPLEMLVGDSQGLLSALCLPEHGQTCGRKGMEQLCVSTWGGEKNREEKPQLVVGFN